MKAYSCYAIYKNGNEIGVEVRAEDFTEAKEICMEKFEEDEELSSVLFWNEELNKCFASYNRDDGWNRLNISEWFTYIYDNQ